MSEQSTPPHDDPREPRTSGEDVFFRDTKPYEVIDHLERLRGPAGGHVVVPPSIWWAPGDGRIDLDEPGGFGLLYRTVLSEGTTLDQERFLNREVLLRIWPELMLPRRVRAQWEATFPELTRPAA